MTEPSGAQSGATNVSNAAATAAATPSADAAAAGALLRQAREAQGLQLAGLAAAIKVSPAKLEALEAGRLGELPDLTFARALAQTVCRALKTDAAPVLARMPGATPSRLERVDEGLNTPMPERGHGLALAAWAAGGDWAPWQRPVPWLAGLLLVAAAAFVLVPRRAADPGAAQPVLPAGDGASGVLTAASAAAAALLPASDVAEPSAVSPAVTSSLPPAAQVAAPGPTPAASANALPNAPGAAVAAASSPLATTDGLSLRAVQNTWVQVSDGSGRVLASRVVTAGETLAFDGPLPLKLRIGNVIGTELVFKGQPVDLSPYRRDNVATLTLR